jgi:hypothetical protein
MLTLLDFDNTDKLKNYVFESDFIKFFDLDYNCLIESKERLEIKRVVKGKGKDGKMERVIC